MADVRDIVVDGLRELGVLAQGETATADDALSGLAALNRLIDAWAAERLMIYSNTRTTFAITSGVQDYDVGTGGDVNVARPVFVEHVNFVDTSFTPSREFQMTPLTNDAWSKVPLKALTSRYPTCFYYNPTFPLGTLQLWPIPTASTLTGAMYAPQQVSEFTDLNTLIALPPGYRRMLVKNLALEMAPSYERPASRELVEQAAESKAVVKRANGSLMDMDIEAGALGSGQRTRYRYSILTG